LQQRKIAKESVIMRRSFQKALLPLKMRKYISAKNIFCVPWNELRKGIVLHWAHPK